MGNLILKYDVDKMYTFGFISLLIRLFFSYSDLLQIPGVVDMLLLLVFVACMLLVLIDEKLTGLQFFAVVITGAVCIYSYNKMDNYYLLATYFCMVASKNINLKYVLGWSYKVRVFMLTFHVAVYIFTLINNPNSIKYVYRDGVLRHQDEVLRRVRRHVPGRKRLRPRQRRSGGSQEKLQDHGSRHR